MYIPEHFSVTDEDEIERFIHANGFGEMISTVQSRLFATQMPFLYSRSARNLKGHIARANPQWRDLDGQRVLVILWGPHGYISPSWYNDPGVPTWNYQSVHITGVATCYEDPQRLQEIIIGLTHQYESQFESPWSPEFAASKIRGIIGIDVAIEDIQCKYKLSQNRSPADRNNVEQALMKRGNTALARAMGKLR